MDRDFLNVRALGQFYDILVIPLLTFRTQKPAVFYFSDVSYLWDYFHSAIVRLLMDCTTWRLTKSKQRLLLSPANFLWPQIIYFISRKNYTCIYIYIFNFPCRLLQPLWLGVCISVIIYAILHSVFSSVRVDNCPYKMIDSNLLFFHFKGRKTFISFLTSNQSLPEFFMCISRTEIRFQLRKRRHFQQEHLISDLVTVKMIGEHMLPFCSITSLSVHQCSKRSTFWNFFKV